MNKKSEKATPTAFNGTLKKYTIYCNKEQNLIELMIAKKTEVNALTRENVFYNAQKAQFCAMVDLEKLVENENRTTDFICSQKQLVSQRRVSIRGLSGNDR